MLKITIDGKEVEVEKGTRLIEAVKQTGGEDVPYYCYHPGLSIAGNCRMCLVEVEKMPKLQIACHMQCQDGMVVNTQSERVKQTRQHVLEFLLVNHPVDCPVCDQAGECWLQDYYMKHGLYDSRLNEDKVKKPKAQKIGPNVMLDAERCILCSRCIRFTDEVSKTNELGFINRGNHTEISVAPGRELDNPYSGNTVDICPVGALTDRDFRFKMRVWYLKEEDSICNGCSRGCNIQVHYNLDRPHHTGGERVMRLKPRYNEKVNKWWMCDEGRYGYKYHDHDRILTPLQKEGSGQKEIDWYEGIAQAASRLADGGQNIAVLLSPQLSNEEIYLAKKLFVDQIKAKHVTLVSPHKDGSQDDILIQADKNPNTHGAVSQGFQYDKAAVANIVAAAKAGDIKGLVVLGQNLENVMESADLETLNANISWKIFIGSNSHAGSQSADIVLPAATHFEKEGTFNNFEGIVQKFNKVIEPLGVAQSEWEIFRLLAKALGTEFNYTSAEAIFTELAKEVKAFEGITYEQLEVSGSDVRTMAAPTIPALEQYDNIL